MAVGLQKIMLVVFVVAVLVFLAGYPNMTGNASLCIITKPSSVVQQAFSENEPYTVYKETDKPLSYVIISQSEGSNFYDYLYRKFGKLEVKNTDAHSGIFTVMAKFTDGINEETQTLSYDVPPEKSKLFYFEYFDKARDTDKANVSYRIIAPIKVVREPVTYYRNITETKSIEVKPEVSCL